MDTHLCSWNFLVDSKDKIAPAFTWKPIMNRLNTDMVYSSERQIFDIQTRDIMYTPPPTPPPPPNKDGLYSQYMSQELCQLVSLALLEGPPF